jgi:hypothetical protein
VVQGKIPPHLAEVRIPSSLPKQCVSISSTAIHFIFTCGEFFTCGESFLQLHSSTTLYFIFIFIKIIFLLFYFNFFFSLLISLFSLLIFIFFFFFFAVLSQDPRQPQTPRQQTQTHGKQTQRPTANKPKPTANKPKPTANKPKDPRQTQTHGPPPRRDPKPKTHLKPTANR